MKDLSSHEMEEIMGGDPPAPPPSGPPIAPEGESNDPYEGPNGSRRPF